MAQCTLDADGNLKDASKIDWYYDTNDLESILKPTTRDSSHHPQHNTVLAEKLKDLNNVQTPGLVFQQKAVK